MHTQTSTAPAPTRTRIGIFSGGVLLFLGVLLPLGVLVLEGMTGFCAGVFFDPIPTVWHILFAACVPLSNLLTIVALRRGTPARRRAAIGTLNAFALVAAFYFAWVYLSLTPLAFLALIVFGMGLLPLSPALSLLAAAILRLKLRRWTDDGQPRPVPGLLVGCLVGALCAAAFYIPPTVTRIAAHSLVRGEGGKTAIDVLRRYGDHRLLLAACYREMNGMADPIEYLYWGGAALSTAEAQSLYYRITGHAFDTVGRPGRLPSQVRRDWVWDENLGTSRVGPRLAHVSMSQSRLDGIVDAGAATAYFQWTMVFRNDDFQQREARLRIALPKDAVVSRATLWIDGDEREAAFGGREQTRQAYTSVAVRQRRDPLLVTTSGADDVLVQCFPIPSHGEMKIRIGITSPLELISPDSARVALPHIIERNYNGQTGHSLWITGNGSFASDVQFIHERQEDVYTLRGELPDALIARPNIITVAREGSQMAAWTDVPAGAESRRILQTLEARTSELPGSLVLAIDLSRQMTAHLGSIEELLKAVPDGTRVAVFAAGDEVVPVVGELTALDTPLRERIASQLKSAVIEGGADNVPALQAAWDCASGNSANVLWLHTAQPHEYAPLDGLTQRLERRPSIRIYSAQLGLGSDVTADRLDGLIVAGRAESAQDVIRLVAGRPWQAVRRELSAEESPPEGAIKADGHLTRLWVMDEVRRLIANRASAAQKSAIELATRAQLVTPVTGAVVLETQQQYAQHNLQPVDPSSTPGIPEPASLGAVLVGAYLLSRRPRRGQRPAT